MARALTPAEATGADRDVTLRFSHPAIADALEVATGANRIRWAYNLNTVRFPTYQGEVLQILSASIGTMTISGNTLNNIKLAQIYKWFRTYMSLAGTQDHNQEPVVFTYAERNWQLGLYITQAPSFVLGRDRVATEWQITGEVAQEDQTILEEAVLASLRYPMTQSLNWNDLPRGIGYVPIDLNAHSSPVPVSQDARVINAATASLQKYANKIGDSFDSLIGAWSSGDMAHFMFDATAGAATNELSPAEQYWRQVFGSDSLSGDSGTGQGSTPAVPGRPTGSNTSLSQLSGILDPEQVAAVMVAAGFPANEDVLTTGVAISYAESDWLVSSDNGQCCVGLFQININPGGGLSSTGGYRTGTISVDGRSVGFGELTHDPVLNARAAKAKYDGAHGWGTPGGNPWEAYGNDKYQGILPEARAAVRRYLANPSRWDGNRLGGVVVGGGIMPTGDVLAQAKALVNAGAITFDGGTNGPNGRDFMTGRGQSIGGPSVSIHPNVYKVIIGICNTPGIDTVNISSLTSTHLYLVHNSTRVSQHSVGQAVDINILNGSHVMDGSNYKDLMIAWSNQPTARLVNQIIAPEDITPHFPTSDGYGNDADHENHVHIGILPNG